MKFRIRQAVIPVMVVLFFSCSPSENQQDSGHDFSGSLTKEEIENGRLTPEVLWKFGSDYFRALQYFQSPLEARWCYDWIFIG